MCPCVHASACTVVLESYVPVFLFRARASVVGLYSRMLCHSSRVCQQEIEMLLVHSTVLSVASKVPGAVYVFSSVLVRRLGAFHMKKIVC